MTGLIVGTESNTLLNQQASSFNVRLLCLLFVLGFLAACNQKAASPAPVAVAESAGAANATATSPSSALETQRDKASTDLATAVNDAAWTWIDPAGSHVTWTYHNGDEADHCTILESLGGGVAALDFDNDGRTDLCATGGGQFGAGNSISGLPNALFRNLGDWKFQACAQASRIDVANFYTHGLAQADFNNDGYDDLAITGFRGLNLWVGMGDGTFVEAAGACGIEHQLWSSSAAWADLDNDQDLDLYVANYVDWSFENHPQCRSADGRRDICPPKSFSGLPHTIYFNQGDGLFQSADAAIGLIPGGKGLGVVIADVDGDGWQDIYVANDTTNNFLYINDHGQFTEQGELSGVALDDRGLPNGSMGVDVMDYNRDGKLDIWVCNYEDETFALYRNMGSRHFTHSSKATGLNSFGQRFVGFGTACVDFDADGDEDVVVANGHVIKFPNRSPRKQVPLYLSNEKARFARQSFSATHYLGQPHEGRGLATADFDGDGDLDIAISNCNEPLALLRNEATSTRQMTIKLVGTSSNRNAIGAVATLKTDKGQYQRTLKGGGSYLSTSEILLHFGWSAEEVPQQLIIRWPGGSESMYPPASATLIEKP